MFLPSQLDRDSWRALAEDNMTRCTAVLIGFVVFMGCSESSKRTRDLGLPEQPVTTEYQIYSAIIDSEIPPHLLVVICDSTRPWGSRPSIDPGWSNDLFPKDFALSDCRAILKSYDLANRTRCQLKQDSLHTKHVSVVVPNDSLWTMLRAHADWEEVYATLRGVRVGRVAEFSRVGFNTSHDKALVHYGWHASGEMGVGSFMVLVKTGRGWVVVARMQTWVS